MTLRKSLAGLLGCAFLTVSTSGHAELLEMKSLQNKLDQEHAGWKASENWVSKLDQNSVKRMLGYPNKVRYGKDIVFIARAGSQGGSDAVDWRNKDGQNWVSPILNQGNCGSCVAYATVATLETQMNIARNYPWLDARFSTDALFACGGGSCDSGWTPDSAASFLQQSGVPDEACMPSTMSATGQVPSCSAMCADGSSRSQRIAGFDTHTSRDAVKAALKNGPLITTLDVYADFLLYSSGVYKHTTGDYEGGHAVSLIGFDDSKQAWIIRNSWGPDWGDHGFAYVSYDDSSGVGDQTWSLSIPGVDGVASIKNLHDHDFLAGTVALDATSSYIGTTGITLHVSGANGEVNKQSCTVNECIFNLDTTKLADGRYESYIEVTQSKGTVTSEKKYFYVVNAKPTMNLTFQPNGFNPQQASDRVVFDITATTSSVPMQALTLVVKQNGKTVFTKGADIVLPQMSMGWRTPFVPNGAYTVNLVGSITAGGNTYSVESNSIDVTVQN
jgi:C1A family cysteine protease